MPTVIKTAQAEQDIIDIGRYLVRQQDIDRAKTFLRKLDQKLTTLAASPGIGRPRDELRVGLRSFPFKPYVIIYQPMPDGIILVRVLHGHRDISALFSEESE